MTSYADGKLAWYKNIKIFLCRLHHINNDILCSNEQILCKFVCNSVQIETYFCYYMCNRHSNIEEHHRCFGLVGYFMAAVLAAASYCRIGFSLYFAVRARRVRVPDGIKLHLEPGTIHPFRNLNGTWCLWRCSYSLKIAFFFISDRGGGWFLVL